MHRCCLVFAAINCLALPVNAQSTRDPHHIYDGSHPRDSWYDMLLYRCDAETQSLRIATAPSRNSDAKDNSREQGMEPLKESLLECGSSDWRVRVKFIRTRSEAQGACHEGKYVSVWINGKKAFRTRYYGCPASAGYEYIASHLIDTRIEIDGTLATVCQLEKRCESFDTAEFSRDETEYGENLLWHERSRAYRLIDFDPAYKAICDAFGTNTYPIQPSNRSDSTQLPKLVESIEGVVTRLTYYDPRQKSARRSRFAKPEQASVELINADINRDGEQELFVQYSHPIGPHGRFSRKVVLSRQPFANEANKTDVAAQLMACDTATKEECEFSTTLEYEWSLNEFRTDKLFYFSPYSRLNRFDGMYFFNTVNAHSDLYADSAIISAIGPDYSLKHICYFDRVHPNY